VEVSRLYRKGFLVNIDKYTRVPPLDAPLRPSLFGEDAELQRGALTRRVSMRISVIDESTSRAIEKRRKALRGLLDRFTFSLADGVRWMPRTARPIFELEAARVESEGRSLVDALVKDGIDKYLSQRRPSVQADIEQMLKATNSRTIFGTTVERQVDQVMQTLKDRLEKATKGRFLPTLAYSPVEFLAMEDAGASPWGQALTFLLGIARYPRRAMTDRFFWQGLKVDDEDLLTAMDVAGDAARADRNARGFRQRCENELKILERIEQAPAEPRRRSQMVLQVIRGTGTEQLSQELTESAGIFGEGREPGDRPEVP
jgi:hypothetical protein